MVHFVCISFLDFRFLYWNFFFYKFLLSDKRFASGFIWIIHLMDFSVCHFGLRFLSFFFQLTFFFVPGIIFIWSSCRFGLCCICPDYLPSGWALNEGKRIFHLNFMFGSNWILAYTFDLLHSVSLFSADQWRFPFFGLRFSVTVSGKSFLCFQKKSFLFFHTNLLGSILKKVLLSLLSPVIWFVGSLPNHGRIPLVCGFMPIVFASYRV